MHSPELEEDSCTTYIAVKLLRKEVLLLSAGVNETFFLSHLLLNKRLLILMLIFSITIF